MKSSWGSVRQVGEGVYELRWSEGGKRKSKRLRGTKKEADRLLASMRLQIEGAGLGCAVTMEQFWDVWFEPALGELASSTAEGYRQVWRNHVQPRWGRVKMGKVKASEVQKWLLTLSFGVAPHARTLMSSMFGRAMLEDLVDRNPMQARFRLPKRDTAVKKVNRDVLSRAELDAIWQACRGEWWEPTFMLAAFGGLRRAEAIGVCVEDMEFEERGGEIWCAVSVRRGIQRIGGTLAIVEPKTGERIAVVMPPYAERLLELVGDREEGWLVDDHGGPASPNGLTVAWKRWFSTQPFAGVPFKNLRNSYVTWMLEEGYNSAVVSKLCGHSQKVDYRYYQRHDVQSLMRTLENHKD